MIVAMAQCQIQGLSSLSSAQPHLGSSLLVGFFGVPGSALELSHGAKPECDEQTHGLICVQNLWISHFAFPTSALTPPVLVTPLLEIDM